MNHREWVWLAGKGLLAWAVLSGLGWYFGEGLANGLLPLIGWALRWIAPQYAPALKVVPSGHDYLIQLSAWVLQPIQLTSTKIIPVGKELTKTTHLLHTLVPAVIELSILLAWPVRFWRQRLLLLALGLATAPLVFVAIMPPSLLGLVEIDFMQASQLFNEPREEPWVLSWLVFLEMGGRWLLPIVTAWGCILLQQRMTLYF